VLDVRRRARPALVILVSALACGCESRHVSADGIRVSAPAGWNRIDPASDAPVVNPRTVLVIGTRGTRRARSSCQIAAYRVPTDGAVVVIVRWVGSDVEGRRRSELAHLSLTRRSMECFDGRAGAAVVELGTQRYQVNVMIGDHASGERVREALRVARSVTRPR
jgi:hypothetical protein